MKVELKSIKGTWEDVVNRARTTVHKDELGKEPSKILNLKSWVATHFARHHVGVEKWIRTQRSDRTGVNRDELPQGAEVEMEIEANAQALINMSRKRLCNQASPETREVMEAMKEEVSKRDKFVAEVMVKECVYRGFCPEMKPCGYAETPQFQKEVNKYRNPDEEEER